jgi:lipid-A-disaccharide synthase
VTALPPAGGRRRVLIVAGDVSGDAHAARMARELVDLDPSVEIAALGGPALKAAGANLVVDLVSEAVVGFTEVVAHLPGVLKSFATALTAARRADLVVFVDYPGFNLRLAKAIARLSPRPRMLWYIAPQVWAWHRSRAKVMGELLDRIAVVFPFEEKLFPNAVFVGHPLLDLAPPPIDPDLRRDRVVALMPGSRRSEILRHLPVLSDLAPELSRLGYRPIVSMADSNMLPLFSEIECELYSGDARTLLASSERGILKTGTTTLEAALLGLPFAAFYRLSWLSYTIGRMLVDARRFAMPNILLDADVAPEFIQNAATSEALLKAVVDLPIEKIRADWARLPEFLGHHGSARPTAELCLELLSA